MLEGLGDGGAVAAEGDSSREGSVSIAATQSIQSPGPLTNIATSDDLNCAVNYVTDTHGEFYGVCHARIS